MMSANSKKNDAKAVSGSSTNSPKLSTAEWDDLKALCSIHSTPGDEGDAAAFMLNAWADCGWNTSTLGRYAEIGRASCRERV